MPKIGIYAIINTETGWRYVGSSVHLNRRFSSHKYCLRRNIHVNKHLQSSWNKHSEKAFDFLILENLSNSEHMIEREQFFADAARPHIYNKGQFSRNPRIGAKLSQSERAAIGDRSRGLKHSSSFGEKQSTARRDWWSHNSPTTAMIETGKRNAEKSHEILRLKTHCRNGHDYSDAYRDKGARRCRTCQRLAYARYVTKMAVARG